MTIIEERAAQPITLAKGAHSASGGEMCLLEATAWIAGEPWSDHPACVCPVIAAFGRSWNDSLRDDDRNRLLVPYITKLVGTRSTPEVELRRAWMATDWQVRTYTPTWLRLAGLTVHADALASLPELVDSESARTAQATLAAAGDAAGDAAWAAAGAAAGAAAWDAAWDAARDALAPTVVILQDSACDLLDRMIAA